MRSSLILATRGSALALAQSNYVKQCIEKQHPQVSVELLKIKTKGDIVLDRSLRNEGGKGLFVKEIEEALLDGRADLAVHSMKDVPAEIPSELKVGVLLKREDPADVLISAKYQSVQDLPLGARVGTTSLRRKVQLQKLRPDLDIQDLRGNVDTRLKKLKEGEWDAILLAFAGLKRLGLATEATEKLSFIASPGQGAIGIEYRREDGELDQALQFLNDSETFACVSAERVILHQVGGGCTLPLGAQACRRGNEIILKAFVADPEGKEWIKTELSGPLENPEELGRKVSEVLIQKGAKEILKRISKTDF